MPFGQDLDAFGEKQAERIYAPEAFTTRPKDAPFHFEFFIFNFSFLIFFRPLVPAWPAYVVGRKSKKIINAQLSIINYQF